MLDRFCMQGCKFFYRWLVCEILFQRRLSINYFFCKQLKSLLTPVVFVTEYRVLEELYYFEGSYAQPRLFLIDHRHNCELLLRGVDIDYRISCSGVFAENEICEEVLDASRVSIDIENLDSETHPENTQNTRSKDCITANFLFTILERPRNKPGS